MIHPCVPVPAFEALEFYQQPEKYEVGIKLSVHNGFYGLLFIYTWHPWEQKQILFFYFLKQLLLQEKSEILQMEQWTQ